MNDELAPIKLYTDTHIAKAVADQLRAQGVDIVRCEEVGKAEADDPDHFDYATSHGRVMITGDADFLRLHNAWTAQGKSHGGIIFCQPHLQGLQKVGTIIKMCIELHELIAGGAGTVEDDIVNQVLYLG